MNRISSSYQKTARLLLLLSSIVTWQACSKKISSIQETAPDAVYDSYAQSKAFAVVATGNHPMLDDLEDGDLNGLKLEDRSWSWSQFDDSTDGVQLLTIQQAEDAPGSGKNVLYVKGGDWKKRGAGFSAYLVNKTPPRPFGYYDASTYQGIQFWIKANGLTQARIRIGTPETTSVDEGGLCLKNCAEDLEFTFAVTADWQLIQAPFQQFLLPGFKQPGLLDPARIKAIHFSLETLGDYEVWLDDFSFYRD